MGLAHNNRRVKGGRVAGGCRAVQDPGLGPRRRTALQALTPDLVDLLPLLAAGPVLAGYWPLVLFVGWAAVP